MIIETMLRGKYQKEKATSMHSKKGNTVKINPHGVARNKEETNE